MAEDENPDAEPEAAQPDEPKREFPEYERKGPRYRVDELVCEEDFFGRRFFKTPEGRRVCGRRKKRKNAEFEGEACCAPPTGEGPCRVHGAGGGHPRTSGGRYARVLRKLGPAFDKALKDAAILDSRPELALLDTLLEGLVERIESGDSPSWRYDLEATFGELEEAIRRGNQREVRRLMKALGEHIQAGAAQDKLVEDIAKAVDRRAANAHRVNMLTVRRDEKVSLRELALIFARLVEMLRDALPEDIFFQVVPRLRSLTSELQMGRVGAAEVEVTGTGGDDEPESGDAA